MENRFVLKMIVGILLGAGSYANAGASENDFLRVDGYVISMGGRMDYSFIDDHVIVSSDRVFYELKRKMIQTPRPELLDQVGSRVQLDIPVGGVVRAWSIVDKMEEVDLPSIIPNRLN